MKRLLVYCAIIPTIVGLSNASTRVINTHAANPLPNDTVLASLAHYNPPPPAPTNSNTNPPMTDPKAGNQPAGILTAGTVEVLNNTGGAVAPPLPMPTVNSLPTGMCFDPSGNIYVTIEGDSLGHSYVSKYGPDGSVIDLHWATMPAPAGSQFFAESCVITREGKMYVGGPTPCEKAQYSQPGGCNGSMIYPTKRLERNNVEDVRIFWLLADHRSWRL